MTGEADAYAILQVVPGAEWPILQAAYRALTRLYHPDGATPDAARMAEINRAYAHVRSPEQRAAYDADRRLLAVGPGHGSAGNVMPPSAGSDGAFARAAARAGRAVAAIRLDFGRYMDWSIEELAAHDPDYLRWLVRHSSGLRYRSEIQRVLDNVDFAHRDRATA